MLDINHPRARITLKASGYTDRLKSHCRKYIVEDFEARQNIFIEMVQITQEFEEFYNQNFEENKAIVKSILNIILDEIDSKKLINNETDIGKCKVCNGKLEEFNCFYYCNDCSKVIEENLNKLDRITGAAWI